MKKIPVVMCIDVEPDERLIDPNVQKPWTGFELTYEFFSKLRLRLEATTGSPVHFSWFFRMDPQIARTYGSAAWVVTRYSSLIEEIKRAGDALGLHIHAWRWNETVHEWIVDLASQEWVNHCIRMGFESFRGSLNQPCLYFRFGDHWMNNATLALVEKLGARFDLTLEPRQKRGHIPESFTGLFLDYSEVPQYPYQPSKTDFRKSGFFLKRRLWIIPLSAGSTDWSGKSTSPVEAKNGSEVHEGCLDRVDCKFISGWAYDKSRPDTPIDVEIYDNDILLTTATAAIFRHDLLAAGKGNAKHSFNVPVPIWLKDGKSHSIQVKVAGASFYLSNSPKELTCREMNHHEECITLNLSLDSWILCRIIDKLLSSLKNPYLAMVTRSDFSIHPDQHSNLEQTFDYMMSHPLIKQVAFETPAEMIKRGK